LKRKKDLGKEIFDLDRGLNTCFRKFASVGRKRLGQVIKGTNNCFGGGKKGKAGGRGVGGGGF